MKGTSRLRRGLAAAAAVIALVCAGCGLTQEDPDRSSGTPDASLSSASPVPEQTTPAVPTTDAAGTTPAVDDPGATDGATSPATESPGSADDLVDVGEFAVEGEGEAVPFSAANGLVYCTIWVEKPTSGTWSDAVMEDLEPGRDPGVHCMMTTDSGVDESQADDGIQACREQQEEDGVGDLGGGEPVLTAEEVAVASCRSDANPIRSQSPSIADELAAIPVLEPGRTIESGGFRCTATEQELTCTRASDAAGWTVRQDGYTIVR